MDSMVRQFVTVDPRIFKRQSHLDRPRPSQVYHVGIYSRSCCGIDRMMALEVTYAFIGFIMGGIAIIISLYALLTLDEMKQNGKQWIELNQELKKKIDILEKGGVSSPWKK